MRLPSTASQAGQGANFGEIEVNTSLSLDIVIASYNRANLLKNTLQSILSAKLPPGFDVGVIVADNNSTDGTKDTVHDFIPRFNGRLRYIFERKQGKSCALNAGIHASKAELIGLIDDDEEIDTNWIFEVAVNFQDSSLDFLGGPCLPKWGSLVCPEWLPRSHRGLIGWIVPSDSPFEYSKERHVSLVGGNAVVRRRLFDKTGLYLTSLGPGRDIPVSEDLEIYYRFIEAGGKGFYSPKLIIYHHIPAERLQRGFFRRRSFWDGVGIGFISRTKREPVPQMAGIPRYFVRMALECFARWAFVWRSRQEDSFADELRVLELFGRAYGRFFYQGRH